MMAPDLFGSPLPPAGFEAFWAAYPLKKDKAAAQRAYVRALGKVTSASILSSAVIYAELNRHKDQKYIKHAATWLNGECWLNEVEPAMPAKPLTARRVLPPDPPVDPAMRERVSRLLSRLAQELRERSVAMAATAKRQAVEREERRREYLASLGVATRQRPSPGSWMPSQELIDLMRAKGAS